MALLLFFLSLPNGVRDKQSPLSFLLLKTPALVQKHPLLLHVMSVSEWVSEWVSKKIMLPIITLPTIAPPLIINIRINNPNMNLKNDEWEKKKVETLPKIGNVWF